MTDMDERALKAAEKAAHRAIRIELTPEPTQCLDVSVNTGYVVRAAIRAYLEAHTYNARCKEAEEAAIKLKAERAANAVLTERQASCLAAIRMGRSPYYRWDSVWGWQYIRNNGGATRRMLNTLIDEGLLDRHRKLTDAGADRLTEWEKANPKKAEWLRAAP